jgi:hypothetical protein
VMCALQPWLNKRMAERMVVAVVGSNDVSSGRSNGSGGGAAAVRRSSAGGHSCFYMLWRPWQA